MMQYLSPTTFIKFEKCEHRVFLEKVKQVLPKEDYEQEQTLAMATGSAFDIMVKGALNRRIKVKEELGEKILYKNIASIQVAKEMLDCYSRHQLQNLKDEGVGYGSVDQEIEISWGEWKSILYGQVDLALSDGTVIDWKCQGMYGKGKIPVDGYVRCYVYGSGHPHNGKDMGKSPKAEDGIPLEQIDRGWAIQTYLYARLLGHRVGSPLRAGIENICVGPKNEIYCASYRNPILFQEEIEESFHKAWAKLNRLKGLETAYPHASKYTCISYNKLCPVAEFCDSYLEMKKRGVRW